MFGEPKRLLDYGTCIYYAELVDTLCVFGISFYGFVLTSWPIYETVFYSFGFAASFFAVAFGFFRPPVWTHTNASFRQYSRCVYLAIRFQR